MKVFINFTLFYLFAGLGSYFILEMIYMWLYPDTVVGDPMMGLILFASIVIICMIVAIVFSVFLKKNYLGNTSFIWISIIGLVIGIIAPLMIHSYTFKTEVFVIWVIIVYIISLYLVFKKKAGF